MSADKPRERKSSMLIWIIIALVALAFVVAQLLLPDGIRGLLRDLII